MYICINMVNAGEKIYKIIRFGHGSFDFVFLTKDKKEININHKLDYKM